MKQYIIAVCDKEEKYALKMTKELSERLKEPYQIYCFTKIEALKEYLAEHDIYMLIISQGTLSYVEKETGVEHHIILKEEDIENPKEEWCYINRYQDYMGILKEILAYIGEQESYCVDMCKRSKNWKVIGIYSPIHRSLQTTFALSLAQMIGREHQVLYLNFENYSSLSGVMKQEFQEDITDLIYYFDSDREKFKRKLQGFIHSVNGMDFLPPAQVYFDTYEQTGEKWLELFKTIENVTEYEYLVLDLSEAVQGLLSILQYCSKIYTLVKDDNMAKAKLYEYEKWLENHQYKDVLDKTRKFKFPLFEVLPKDIDLLTHGELARYVHAVVQEDLYEKYDAGEEEIN